MNKNILFLVGGIIIVAGVVLLNPFKKNTTTTPTEIDSLSTPPTQGAQVPLPQGEDVVRSFLSLISEGKISDAVNMMVPAAIADDSQKQAWGVQLNAFKKLELKKIESAGDNMYKVTLDVEMKPESAGGPIPFYGYENGENIRWIGLEKVDNLWKITGFATGP